MAPHLGVEPAPEGRPGGHLGHKLGHSHNGVSLLPASPPWDADSSALQPREQRTLAWTAIMAHFWEIPGMGGAMTAPSPE